MKSYNYLIFLFLMCFLSNTVKAQDEIDNVEFAEPLFVDTSTDIGGEKGVLEVNVIPSFKKLDNGSLFELGFEFEYVLFKNFGIEIEPIFTFLNIEDEGNANTFESIELETQYTFIANETTGLAGGIGFELPIEEDGFEIEPFLLYVYRTNWNLSFHPRLGMSIDTSEEEIEFNYNFAVLYTLKEFIVFGVEFNGTYEDSDNTLFISPQIGFELDELYLGSGIQIPTNNNLYNLSLRAIYEFDLK